MTGQPVGISIRDVRFRYPEMEMLFNVDIPPAAITAVMGASGSGKSTLLDLIAGFRMPEAGHILIGDLDVTGCRRTAGRSP